MKEDKNVVTTNADIDAVEEISLKNSDRASKSIKKRIHDILKPIVWLSLLFCFVCFHFVWETAMIISLSLFFISFFVFTFLSKTFDIPDLDSNAGLTD